MSVRPVGPRPLVVLLSDSAPVLAPSSRWASLGLALASATLLMACPSAPAPEAEPGSGPAAVAAPAEAETPELTIGSAFTTALLRGTNRGMRPLAEVAPGCPGLTFEQARHVLEVEVASGLTLSARPVGTGMMDLSFALVGPGGSVVCADDGLTLDPYWAGLLEPGLWVLHVASDVPDPVPYEVQLSAGIVPLTPVEVGSTFPPPVLEGSAATAIAAGDEGGTGGGLVVGPDVAASVLEGSAGGPRPAVELGAPCNGFIAIAPDHLVRVTAPTELTFRVESTGDTTLVIEGPGDTRLCVDDADGLNPVVRQLFAPGLWAVWVGTWEENTQPAYRLTVSR